MESVDAVIIGSGYGGSIPAARLAEAGMKVVVLERGRRMTAADYRQTDDPRYIQEVVDLVVSSSNLAFRTGKLVGGASIPMDGAHFRMPKKSFEVKDKKGRPYWPAGYSRSALDPYFAKAEKMLQVRQFAWGEVPRPGGLFAKMLDAVGASCERARMNYRDCLHCGYCSQGCIYGKKNDLLHNYIPAAEAKGAEFRAGALVSHLEPAPGGYLVRYLRGGAANGILGRRVFVAGGGIHSPAILQRSRPFLPKLSPQLGENFNNNGEHAFIGILPPEFDDLRRYACFKGADNGAVMCFHYFASDGFTLHPGGGFEPSVLAGDLSAPGHPVLPARGWGMEYKRFMETIYPHRLIGFSSLGLADGHWAVAATADGGVDLVDRDRTAHDQYLDRLERIVLAIGKRTGITLIPAVPRKYAGMTSAHLLSACRMAERVEDGVVDGHGQVFGYPNLYVTDASALPYSLAVNPALTISAVAERVVERVIAKG